jgi:hypothetical protein
VQTRYERGGVFGSLIQAATRELGCISLYTVQGNSITAAKAGNDQFSFKVNRYGKPH